MNQTTVDMLQEAVFLKESNCKPGQREVTMTLTSAGVRMEFADMKDPSHKRTLLFDTFWFNIQMATFNLLKARLKEGFKTMGWAEIVDPADMPKRKKKR